MDTRNPLTKPAIKPYPIARGPMRKPLHTRWPLKDFAVASGGKVLTSEELEQEQRPDDAFEEHVPAASPGLVAALRDIQDVVAPVDPGGGKVEQGEGQDDGGGGGVRHCDHVDQQDGTNLAAVADAVGGERVRLLEVGLGDCGEVQGGSGIFALYALTDTQIEGDELCICVLGSIPTCA